MKLGLSHASPCSYLPEQQERLLFTLPEEPLSIAIYQQLTDYNFRRSGDQLYRNHCDFCHACQAVRLEVAAFRPSSAQRRLLRKAKQHGWHWKLVQQPDAQLYFPLYASYIAARHRDGVMYPATLEQLETMLYCQWLPVMALEHYIDDQLMGVMILDPLLDGFSAVYSFYDPTIEMASGILAILAAIDATATRALPFLYLGYLIEGCAKMAYKAQFRPQQRLNGNIWQTFA